MPKKRRKNIHCLNCNYAFGQHEVSNYCPTCGQENTTKIVSIRHLVGDFISTYFSIESKLFTSIGNLLFRPGKLSNAFIEGKHTSYLPPVKMFLVIGVLYVAVFSKFMLSEEVVNQNTIGKVESLFQAKKNVSPDTISTITLPNDSLVTIILPTNEKPSDSSTGTTFTFAKNLSKDSIKVAMKNLTRLAKKYPVEQVMDSFKVQNPYVYQNTPLPEKIMKQSIKIYKYGEGGFVAYLVGSFPFMVLLMIPFLALFNKLLYFFKRRKYVEHLIFWLHYHTFLFVFFGLVILSTYFFSFETEYVPFIILLLTVYLFWSMYKVYKQNWFATFFKQLLVFIVYPIVLTFSALCTILFSFLLF